VRGSAARLLARGRLLEQRRNTGRTTLSAGSRAPLQRRDGGRWSELEAHRPTGLQGESGFGSAKELDEETNLTHRFDFMRHLRLDDTHRIGSQNVLFRILCEDSIA